MNYFANLTQTLRLGNFGAKNVLKCFIAFLCILALQYFCILSLIYEPWKLPPVLLPENKLNIALISHFDYFSKFYTTIQFYRQALRNFNYTKHTISYVLILFTHIFCLFFIQITIVHISIYLEYNDI